MANIRAVGIVTPTVDVPVDGLVALMRDAGGGGSIESMLGFCWRCASADFVSTFVHAGKVVRSLVGTATTTEADNIRWAADGYMQHYASDMNFGLMSRRLVETYMTYQIARDIASSRSVAPVTTTQA